MQLLPWQSLPDFFVSNPWAVEAIDWLRWSKALWDQWESIIIVVALALIARKLTRERGRLGERVDTLGQHVKAAGESADAAIAASKEASEAIVAAIATSSPNARPNGHAAASSPSLEPEPADTANWEQVSSIWRDLKERIEMRIQDIPHKGVRRKYSHMPRKSYWDVISVLKKDGILGPAVANKLQELDTLFHTVKFRPKKVSAEQLEKFVEGRQMAAIDLPELPDERPADIPLPPTTTMQTQSQSQGQGPLPVMTPAA